MAIERKRKLGRRRTQHLVSGAGQNRSFENLSEIAMEYIDVLWKHTHEDEPVRLVSELDEGRFELRRLEFFMDGTVRAVAGDEIFETVIEVTPVPPLKEINQDAQFEGRTLTASEFDALWSANA